MNNKFNKKIKIEKVKNFLIVKKILWNKLIIVNNIYQIKRKNNKKKKNKIKVRKKDLSPYLKKEKRKTN